MKAWYLVSMIQAKQQRNSKAYTAQTNTKSCPLIKHLTFPLKATLKTTMKTQLSSSNSPHPTNKHIMNPSPPIQQTLTLRTVPSNSSITTIEAAESSIQRLTKTFHRRQRWTEFYNPRKQGSLLPWRSRLADLLDTNAAHLITILLLALDLVVCVVELSAAEIACQSRQFERERWYHWAGVAILGLLGAKSAVQLLALGTAFFGRGGDVVDATAVATALVMEVGLERFGGGLIVVVSLWRVIRVVESAFELGDGEIESQIERVLAEFEGIKEVNCGLIRDLEEKEKTIQRIQEELDLERTPYATPM